MQKGILVTEAMSARERVIGALLGRESKPLPWIEHSLDREVLLNAFGLEYAPGKGSWGSLLEEHLYYLELDKRINEATGCCNLEIPYHYTMAPRVRDPKTFAGLLTDEASLKELVFVELSQKHWDDLQRLVDAKGDYALNACISTGIGHIWQTMDLTAFSVACLENPGLLHAILRRYTDWTCRVLQKVQTMGVDFLWCFDDFAFKTGTVYSPQILREIVLPYALQVAAEIRLPWIFHSDGNLMGVLDELRRLGMNALNPLEHGCMDIPAIQKRYPDLTLIGNLEVRLLADGSPEEIRRFVRDMFRLMNRNNRFIPASGNSIPPYAKPENVRAFVAAIWACAR